PTTESATLSLHDALPILGIAPVAPDVNFIDDESIDPGENKVELFWIWYPAARQILHEAQVYNQQNSARPISFDMLLNARRFNAVDRKSTRLNSSHVKISY